VPAPCGVFTAHPRRVAPNFDDDYRQGAMT
jgi:hypothetical protein